MKQENGLPLANLFDDDAASIVIELEAHEASRFEWRVGVPLPTHQHLNYTVQTEFELPSEFDSMTVAVGLTQRNLAESRRRFASRDVRASQVHPA